MSELRAIIRPIVADWFDTGYEAGNLNADALADRIEAAIQVIDEDRLRRTLLALLPPYFPEAWCERVAPQIAATYRELGALPSVDEIRAVLAGATRSSSGAGT